MMEDANAEEYVGSDDEMSGTYVSTIFVLISVVRFCC